MRLTPDCIKLWSAVEPKVIDRDELHAVFQYNDGKCAAGPHRELVEYPLP